jgi:regulator of replication initiation timing
MQDAEAAREKILKASDQIDLMETNSEATKTAVDAMKTQIAKLQDDNTALKQQLADLQAAFDKAEAAHDQERQTMIDEVAKLVASNKSGTKTTSHKKEITADIPVKAPEPDADTEKKPAAAAHETPAAADPASGANITPSTASTPASAGATTDDTPPPKPQKGYYHIVATGETLTLICTAYREQGIKVTVGAIQKANGLSEKSVLKVGQKLFIPKPGP